MGIDMFSRSFLCVVLSASICATALAQNAAIQSQIFGTVTSIDGTEIVVQLRSGQTVKVNLSAANISYSAITPVINEYVQATGTFDHGEMIATSLLRAKQPAAWGPDIVR